MGLLCVVGDHVGIEVVLHLLDALVELGSAQDAEQLLKHRAVEPSTFQQSDLLLVEFDLALTGGLLKPQQADPVWSAACDGTTRHGLLAAATERVAALRDEIKRHELIYDMLDGGKTTRGEPGAVVLRLDRLDGKLQGKKT